MCGAENNDHQGSWGSILLIYGIGVLGATTISARRRRAGYIVAH